MRLVELGADKIPAVAIGTWSWGTGLNGGNRIFGNSYGFEELLPVFKYGVQKGLTLWDTAAVYGMGASEAILGACIKQYSDIIISTKFTPFGIQRKNAMIKSFGKSTKRLNLKSINIYWIHNASNVNKWTRQAVDLYKTGKVRHIGVSNHNLAQIRETSDILEWCKGNDTRFFAYMVLEQGALTGKYSAINPFKPGTKRAKAFPVETLHKLAPLNDCMETIAEKHCAEASQVAIAWAIGKGTIPLVGATKIPQIESISKADKIILDKSETERIEQAALKTGVIAKASWE